MPIFPHAPDPGQPEPAVPAGGDLPHGLAPRPLPAAVAAFRQHMAEGRYIGDLLREGAA